nr:2,3-bisphosphoglycerate-independent phosphoglycerate mutase [Tanacetum cinerariifolium]
MGNSKVGHNALGAGRIFAQGAKLVGKAFASGKFYEDEGFKCIKASFATNTLHLIGLMSDGGVHSRLDQLQLLLNGASERGAKKIRVHVLTDGCVVLDGSSVGFAETLEAELASLRSKGIDAHVRFLQLVSRLQRRIFNGADPASLCDSVSIEFTNEEATGNGVLRESFMLVCQGIFNPQNALLLAYPTDRRRFFPNPALSPTTLVGLYYDLKQELRPELERRKQRKLMRKNYLVVTPLLLQDRLMKPQERMRVLSDALKVNNYDAEPLLKSCGISISSNFTQVEGRVLPAPMLKVRNGEDFLPQNGRWNFNNKKPVNPRIIEKWVVDNFSARCDIRNLVRDLNKCGGLKGI